MRGRQCISSTRNALYSVFVSPVQHAPATRSFSTILPRTQTTHSAPLIASQAQIRSYTRHVNHHHRPGPQPRNPRDSEVVDEELGFDRRFTTKESMEKSGRDRLPRDHEIKDPKVMVLENGSVEGPLATRFVLTKLGPTESLRMVQPYTPANKAKDEPAKYPVCQIVDKKTEYEKEKEKKERKKTGGKPKTKEMELSWGIGEHDVGTKMKQLSGFLKKGMKVEIVLGKKKKGKETSKADAAALLRKVKEEVELNGGKLAKPETGELGASMRMLVETKQS